MKTKYLFFFRVFIIFGIIAHHNITLSADKHMGSFYTKENIERMKEEDTGDSKPWPDKWLPSIVERDGEFKGRSMPPKVEPPKPPCETPLLSAKEAEDCVHYRFSRAREDNLLAFARNHIGDTRNCVIGEESHFSSDLEEFVATLGNARMKCQSNTQNHNTYFCLGETSEKMCHRDIGIVYTLRAVIDKRTARFVTLSPSQYGSDRIN